VKETTSFGVLLLTKGSLLLVLSIRCMQRGRSFPLKKYLADQSSLESGVFCLVSGAREDLYLRCAK
jgi:hypothetical protein